MLSFCIQAEDENIRGDKNHDGVLSGEEQFLRDNIPPPPEPEVKKTAPKKTIPRTMPAVGVTEIDTGYGVKGWVARADGLQPDSERLKYLQADIVHASTDDYKQRTEVSNAIVQQRFARNRIMQIVESAQRNNINMETLLWQLKMEGYKHIMPPMTVLEDANHVQNELQATRNYNAQLQSQQSRNYGTIPYPLAPQYGQPYPYQQSTPAPYYGQAPIQGTQPYYYPQSAPMYYGYAPQQQSIIPNPQAPLPTVRNGQLEYSYGTCNLPTVRNGQLECR